MRTIALTLGLLSLGALWSTACATSVESEGGDEGASSSSSSGGAEGQSGSGGSRPAFDASFDPVEDDGSTGSTTDAGEPTTCADDDDPGSSENTARQLPATDDCDNNMKTVKGVLNGAVDVDFYKLSGTDKFGCGLDTEFSTSTQGVELCVYARCKNATPNAVSGCASGTLDSTSIPGMKGCCATAGKATPRWDCSGITDNDSADFVLRVKRAAGGDACRSYSFAYRF